MFWKRTPLVILVKVKPEDVQNKWRTWTASRLAQGNSQQNLTTPARSTVPFSCLTCRRVKTRNFHRQLLLPRTCVRSIEEGGLRKNEAEKIQFEPWPHASKFGSWKLSCRREVISGSTYQQLVSECLTEIDVATRMEGMEYSGFVFDKHQTELKTLDSKTAKGILKIVLLEFKRMIYVIFLRGPAQKQPPNAHQEANNVPDLLVLRQ